jgi:hypothetical protein
MGFIDDDSMVRVDFFKCGGDGRPHKWYCTEGVKWTGEYEKEKQLIYDAFKKSLRDHLKGRLTGMVAVCLEPCHEYMFPLIAYVDDLENNSKTTPPASAR